MTDQPELEAELLRLRRAKAAFHAQSKLLEHFLVLAHSAAEERVLHSILQEPLFCTSVTVLGTSRWWGDPPPFDRSQDFCGSLKDLKPEPVMIGEHSYWPIAFADLIIA